MNYLLNVILILTKKRAKIFAFILSQRELFLS